MAGHGSTTDITCKLARSEKRGVRREERGSQGLTEHQPEDSAPLLSDTTERETARLLFLSSTDLVFFNFRMAVRASLASTDRAFERLPRLGNIFSSLDFSTDIAFKVCHLAMGRRGLASISDQCFSSALLELQPTSTQPQD